MLSEERIQELSLGLAASRGESKALLSWLAFAAAAASRWLQQHQLVQLALSIEGSAPSPTAALDRESRALNTALIMNLALGQLLGTEALRTRGIRRPGARARERACVRALPSTSRWRAVRRNVRLIHHMQHDPQRH